MNIIVFLKQVPSTNKVDIDEQTGTLKRIGVESKMNPYDLYALETAMKIKEMHGGRVAALTMGPAQASEVLRESFSIGVDEGTLLTDKAFAGSDVLATSCALSAAVKKLEPFDIIICGKQTTDGDTAQVGPETAEFLNIPHVSNVIEIMSVSEKAITLKSDMGESVFTLEVQLPCLISVDKDIYIPRLPSYKKRIKSAHREITTLTLDDLGKTNPKFYGQNGSPTTVERIFPPETNVEKISVTGSGEEIALFLYEQLKKRKFV